MLQTRSAYTSGSVLQINRIDTLSNHSDSLRSRIRCRAVQKESKARAGQTKQARLRARPIFKGLAIRGLFGEKCA